MPAGGSAAGYSNDVLAASATQTVTGNSGILANYGGATTLRCQLNVSAASGTTPTLDVTIQDSLDGTTWNTIGTFTQATTVTRQVINITTPFADQIRVLWTIGGTTPSFTFDIRAASQSPLS